MRASFELNAGRADVMIVIAAGLMVGFDDKAAVQEASPLHK